jgi:hypothetical protein
MAGGGSASTGGGSLVRRGMAGIKGKGVISLIGGAQGCTRTEYQEAPDAILRSHGGGRRKIKNCDQGPAREVQRRRVNTSGSAAQSACQGREVATSIMVCGPIPGFSLG